MELRERTGNWFEIKVKYEKMAEGNQLKDATELYVLDAINYTEAETQIMEEVSCFASGGITIKDIKQTRYKELFFSDLEMDDKWFKVKVNLIIYDEKTEKEKRSAIFYMVQAGTLAKAVEYTQEVLGKGMTDWELVSVNETQVLDVFEHHAPEVKSGE